MSILLLLNILTFTHCSHWMISVSGAGEVTTGLLTTRSTFCPNLVAVGPPELS